MKKSQSQKVNKHKEEKMRGYGNKKLEGPNRPST
jgi:hypothetical protein